MLCKALQQYVPVVGYTPVSSDWSRTWHQAGDLAAIRNFYQGDQWSSLFYRMTLAQLLLFSTSVATHHMKRVPPGPARLLLALPVLVILYGVPFLFSYISEPFIMMCMCFVSFRMAVGKVLALVLGRGPLALDLPFHEFGSLMLAPIMPADLDSGLPRQLPQTACALNPKASSCPIPLTNPPTSIPVRHPGGKKGGDESLQEPSAAAAAAAAAASATPPSTCSSSSNSNGSILEPDGTISNGCRSGSCSRSSSYYANGYESGTGLVGMCSGVLQEVYNSGSCSIPTSSSSNISSSSSSNIPTTNPNLILNLLVIIAFCCYSFHSWRAALATAIRIGGLWFMWRAMDFIMNIAARTCEFWWGLALAPHFYYPLGSTSLADFWGRRWNLTQGLVLKHYVYQPVVEGRWLAESKAAPARAAAAAAGGAECAAPAPGTTAAAAGADARVCPASTTSSGPTPAAGAAAVGEGAGATASHTTAAAADELLPPSPAAAAGAATPVLGAGLSGPTPAAPAAAQTPTTAAAAGGVPPRWRRNTAVCLTFLVSGIEHEIYRWYMTNRLGYQWLLFFTLQGPLMALEKPLKRRARALGFQLHPWVSPLAVLMVLGVMADAWFWPVVTDEVVVGHCWAALRADAAAVYTWLGC